MAQRKGSGGSDDRTAGGASGLGGTTPVGATQAVDAVTDVDAIDPSRAAAGPSAVRGVGATQAQDGVAEIAAALRAGALTVAEAVDRLIEDALQKQVGRAIEPGSDVEARLREILRGVAGADPLISAKIRRLEGRRPTR